MFAASPFPFARSGASACAYRRVGVETGVAGASPHRLVSLLFDGFMEALAQARGALAQRDAAAKGAAIGRAVRIVEEGLKAGLDTQAGGRLAEDLRALYAYVVVRLTRANLDNDDAALAECQRLIEPVRDAWARIAAEPAAR